MCSILPPPPTRTSQKASRPGPAPTITATHPYHHNCTRPQTLAWEPFLAQTLAMVRDRAHSYKRGPGYVEQADPATGGRAVVEQYWEIEGPVAPGKEPAPYRVELVGVYVRPEVGGWLSCRDWDGILFSLPRVHTTHNPAQTSSPPPPLHLPTPSSTIPHPIPCTHARWRSAAPSSGGC